MTKQALIRVDNLKHNAPAALAREKSLTQLAQAYLLTEVAGQARATFERRPHP